MMGDPSTGVSVDSGTDTDNLNHSESTRHEGGRPEQVLARVPVSKHTPEWVTDLLSDRQLEKLNPSFLWLVVVQRSHVLSSQAVTVAAGLYTCSGKDGMTFYVGMESILMPNLARSKGYVRRGIADLAAAGFLRVVEGGRGDRAGYALTLPLNAPSGYERDPRRTTGSDSDPRRTESVSEGTGTHRNPTGTERVPDRVSEEPGTGSQRVPHGAVQSASKSASEPNARETPTPSPPEGDVVGSLPPPDVREAILAKLRPAGPTAQQIAEEEEERERRRQQEAIREWQRQQEGAA